MRSGLYIIGDIFTLSSIDAISYGPCRQRMFGDMDGIAIDPYAYLAGECDIFALWLHECFGYEIETRIVKDGDDGSYDNLIHAYCVADDRFGQKNWIDIRGITDDYDEMYGQFLRSERMLVEGMRESYHPKAYANTFRFPGNGGSIDDFMCLSASRNHDPNVSFEEIDKLVSGCNPNTYLI